MLGQQAVCTYGCDPENPSITHIYTGSVMRNLKEGLRAVVLAVNWGDTDSQDVLFAPIDHDLAINQTDNCTMRDLWTKEEIQLKGKDVQTWSIGPHSHVVKLVKCTAF